MSVLDLMLMSRAPGLDIEEGPVSPSMMLKDHPASSKDGYVSRLQRVPGTTATVVDMRTSPSSMQNREGNVGPSLEDANVALRQAL